MRIIRPTIISSAMLTACNVAEDEYPAWTTALQPAGTLVIYSHKIYEAVVDSTDVTPGSDPSKWLDLGYDNRWRMFDQKVGSQTSKAESVTCTVAPGIIDSIAFLDMEATVITVSMTDPIEGLVYSETVDLIQESMVIDAYTYIIEPIITAKSTVLMGIPAYLNASISITVSNPGGTAKVGTIAFGIQKELGATQYNPSVSIKDYSVKEQDSWGNWTIVEGQYSSRLSCDLQVENTSFDDIAATLTAYRAAMLIWVGADVNYASLIVYGIFRSFDMVIEGPVMSTCQLKIEGLT